MRPIKITDKQSIVDKCSACPALTRNERTTESLPRPVRRLYLLQKGANNL